MSDDPLPCKGLDAVLARHRERLLAVADGILHDPAEAEDVVQDTVAAVCRKLKCQEIPRLRNYLYRAVRVNALKRRSRRRWVHLGEAEAVEAPMAEADGLDEPEIDPLTLERAILSLPPAQQAVIRMKYYLDMSFRQIGLAMAVSLHTAASRCRYALAKLRESLSTRSHTRKDQP